MAMAFEGCAAAMACVMWPGRPCTVNIIFIRTGLAVARLPGDEGQRERSIRGPRSQGDVKNVWRSCEEAVNNSRAFGACGLLWFPYSGERINSSWETARCRGKRGLKSLSERGC